MSELLIYGEIGSDVRDREVSEVLASAEGDLTVRVNSPGGDVSAGFTIMNRLREYPGHVTAVVEGIAASAASFIVVGGADRVVLRPQAEIMVHDALSMIVGNQADLMAAADDLSGYSDRIAQIYAEKTGGEPSEWREVMRAETWFSAEEAVAAGLADAVEDGRKVAALGRTPVMASFRYSGRRDAPAPTVNSPSGHNRKEQHVSALTDLAQELGLSEDQIKAAIGRVVTNEEVTVTSTIDITYPEGNTVVPTGKATVEPTGEIPPGIVFTIGEAPEGWTAEVDEETGVVAVTAPAGAEPDDEVELTVTATGSEPVELPVVVTVKAAAGEDEGDDASTTEELAPAEHVTLDMDTYNDLKAAAKLGWDAKATADKQARAGQVDAWIREGRVNAAHRSKVVAAMEKNEQAARDLYGNIPRNTIPVAEIGHVRDAEDHKAAKNADFKKRADAVLRSPNLF